MIVGVVTLGDDHGHGRRHRPGRPHRAGSSATFSDGDTSPLPASGRSSLSHSAGDWIESHCPSTSSTPWRLLRRHGRHQGAGGGLVGPGGHPGAITAVGGAVTCATSSSDRFLVEQRPLCHSRRGGAAITVVAVRLGLDGLARQHRRRPLRASRSACSGCASHRRADTSGRPAIVTVRSPSGCAAVGGVRARAWPGSSMAATGVAEAPVRKWAP